MTRQLQWLDMETPRIPATWIRWSKSTSVRGSGQDDVLLATSAQRIGASQGQCAQTMVDILIRRDDRQARLCMRPAVAASLIRDLQHADLTRGSGTGRRSSMQAWWYRWQSTGRRGRAAGRQAAWFGAHWYRIPGQHPRLVVVLTIRSDGRECRLRLTDDRILALIQQLDRRLAWLTGLEDWQPARSWGPR